MTEYEQLSAAIESRIASDPQLRALRKKIKNGTATLAESSKYSQLCAQIMGQKLSGKVLELSDREGVCTQLLHDRYSDTNQICEQVMRSVDETAGIAMNPRHAAFPAERVQQLAHSLTDPTVPDETIQRRANTGAANVAISFHDDFVDENAAFRSDAGYECYITRVVGGASCPWCSGMAGRYKYEEMPEDMFRRHDNCTCTVTFEQGSFRQDVWSKRSWEAPETGAGAPPPKVFSQEEADRLEQEHLAQIRGLRFNSSSIDIPEENGIIQLEKPVQVPDDYVYIKSAENNFHKFEDNDLSIDILEAIENTIAKRHNETSDFHFDSFLIAKFDNAHEKSVFITDLIERGSELKTTLYINKAFVIGKTKAQVDSMCKTLKEAGWWQSESIEDLVEHEIVHARLGYINGAYKSKQLYDMLTEDIRVKGFCRLVDNDKSEFMNEMTVALNRGESVKKEYLDVYEEYAKDYLGGAIHG